ncbi:hypothetical protein O3P69_009282 [Scylla paramamosain]|uniref:Uncharacterized protein n=1 Tax=Scylla paramamosain TaxID=85552 RepID=A0AAW0TA71_SCYPA
MWGLSVPCTKQRDQRSLFHNSGHVISYHRLLQVDTGMAEKTLQSMDAKTGAVTPPNFVHGRFIHFTRDNIDINDSGRHEHFPCYTDGRRQKTGSLGARVFRSPRDRRLPQKDRRGEELPRQKRLEMAQAERKKADYWVQDDSEFNDFPMAEPSADQENDDFVSNLENNDLKPSRHKIRNKKAIMNKALANIQHPTKLQK